MIEYYLRDNNNSLLDKRIEGIIKKYKDTFGVFARPFLIKMKKMLENMRTIFNDVSEINGLISGILEDSCENIIRLSVKTLLMEFNIYKGKCAKNKKGISNYEEFYASLEEKDFVEKIYRKYPVLLEILSSYVYKKVNYIKEVLSKFEKDKKEIKEMFDISLDERITRIIFTDGDPHEGGKTPIILEFGSKKIIYKNRNLDCEYLFYELMRFFDCDKSKNRYYIKSISRSDYSWQEYIRYKEADNQNDINDYYNEIGKLIFVMDMLNCHDNHKENIIINNGPKLIDMETLVDAAPFTQKEFLYGDVLICVNECANSVLGTLLLPTNCIFMPFDYDVSAISGQASILTDRWYAYLLVDKGTDNIHLEKQYYIQNVRQDSNVLKLNGEMVNPREYISNIVDGYYEAYGRFKLCKNEIRKKLNSTCIRIRQVVRPTAIYSRFLEASEYGDYLTDNEKYVKLLSKIAGNNVGEKEKIEIEALIDRDIPYFFSDLTSRNLYSGNEVVKDYFSQSPLEIILNKMSIIDEDYIKKQMYYIRLSMSTLKCSKLSSNKIWGDNLSVLSFAINIADNIEKYAIKGNDGKCYMLTTILDDRNKNKISIMNGDLYEGGGILIFLASIYRLTGKKKYLKLCNEMYRAFDEESMFSDCSGGFCGMMSFVYVSYLLYKLSEKKDYLKRIEALMEKLLIEEITIEDDIIAGKAGATVVAINIAKDGQHNLMDNYIKRLSESLYKSVRESEYTMTGFAHGLSGIALALYKAGIYLNDERFIEESLRCIRKENAKYVPNEANWKDTRNNEANISTWCYGAAGIVLSRVLMCKEKFNEEIKNDIEKGKRSINIEALESHCLCHGKFGNIRIAEETFRFENMEGLEMLQLKKRDTIEEMLANGFRAGESYMVEDYSFMKGLTGVAYELIREIIAVPNVLALEV